MKYIILILLIGFFGCTTYHHDYRYKLGEIVYVRMNKYIVWKLDAKDDWTPMNMYSLKEYGCDEKRIPDCVIFVEETQITKEPHFVP